MVLTVALDRIASRGKEQEKLISTRTPHLKLRSTGVDKPLTDNTADFKTSRVSVWFSIKGGWS